MALSHDGFNFSSAGHGILEPGPVETPLIFGAFNGVIGVSIIADESKEQVVRCRAILGGYASLQELKTAINVVHAQQGKLTGTLTVTGAVAEEIPKCTFVAFDVERCFLDGSGVNGWTCFGRLVWIRRARS